MNKAPSRALVSVIVAAALAALAGVADTEAGVSRAAADPQNPRVYVDPTGDSPGGPDISSVVSRNTAAGMISFDVSIANGGTVLPDSALVDVFIDADRNDATGRDGFEYLISSWGAAGAVRLGHWDGFNMVEAPAPSLIKMWKSGGSLTFQIARHDLNDTNGFYFWVGTWTEREPSAPAVWDDLAPDGNDVYEYTLSMPHAVSADASFAPASPRAGRRFSVARVNFTLETHEVVPAISYVCRATLGRKTLRGSGLGGCTFVLSPDAKKKRLSIAITAKVGNETSTLHKSFVVR